MTPLPAVYAWVDKIPAPPKLIAEMRAIYGVREGPGEIDNPVILAWAREVGVADVYRHDAIAWCGLAMAVAAKRAGKPVVASPLWAANWAHFGQPAGMQLGFGDVLVFHRPGGGHVGLYVAEDDLRYHVMGGNEDDAVNIVPVLKSRLIAARRPIWTVAQPASVVPHFVAHTGALSANEA